MSRLELLIANALSDPACPPSALEQLRARAVRRRRRLSRRIIAGPLFGGILAVSLVFIGSSGGNGDLGLQVSAASVVPAASSIHMLSSTISLGYVPSGYQLSSDEIDNPAGSLAAYSDSWKQSATYTKTTEAGVEVLTVNVVETGTLFGPGAPIPAPGDLTTVGGHRGVLEVVPYVPSVQNCLQDELGGLAVAPVTTVSLSWLDQPGVMLQINAQGLSVATVRKIAADLVFNSSAYRCLQGFRIVSTVGACEVGTQFSPQQSKAPVVFGQTKYVGGTVNGEAWLLEALGTTFGGSWQFIVRGQTIAGKAQCDAFAKPTTVPTLGDPQIVLAGSASGARFAIGHVPAWVTEVTASVARNSLSQPVLPQMFWGDRFFVLYLGSASGQCGAACLGPVTLRFVRGSKVEATASFSAVGMSTEPLPLTIPAGHFSGNLQGA